jgi:hypothetical protein
MTTTRICRPDQVNRGAASNFAASEEPDMTLGQLLSALRD